MKQHIKKNANAAKFSFALNVVFWEQKSIKMHTVLLLLNYSGAAFLIVKRFAPVNVTIQELTKYNF
jgi:hypothetical protein